MSEREQIKPLTPPSFTNSNSHQHEAIFIDDSLIKYRRRRRNYVRCCGCVTAVVLIIVVTFLIFSFTVYNLKEPQLSLNSVTLINSTQSNEVNKTLICDLSVRNPNVFTFRFDSCSTTVYYNGTGIGEGVTSKGNVMGRETLRVNVTLKWVMTENLMERTSLRSDVMGGKALNISSFTKVGGNVKVLNLIKRKVEVQMNCSVVYNMTSGSSHGEACFTGDAF